VTVNESDGVLAPDVADMPSAVPLSFEEYPNILPGACGAVEGGKAGTWHPPREETGPVTIPLVVGIDGSESSPEAVDWPAAEAARHRQLSSKVLHDDAAATLGQPGRGRPVPGAPNTAGGPVGRGPAGRRRTQKKGAPGLRLGLINHALLHHAPRPVAVVPQT
jgi:hypothetical protein